jgi:MFS family permease
MMTAGVAAGAPAWWFLAGMVITASGSGVFPVTASLTRELSAPDSAAVAIGVQNSLAYLAVAAAANLIGVILDAFRGAPAAGQPVIYPAAAYITVFAVMLFFSAVSIWVALRSGETRGARSGFDLEYESAA